VMRKGPKANPLLHLVYNFLQSSLQSKFDIFVPEAINEGV
jgi:hypothetical protein